MGKMTRAQQEELQLQVMYITAAIRDVWERYSPGIALLLPILLGLLVMNAVCGTV